MDKGRSNSSEPGNILGKTQFHKYQSPRLFFCYKGVIIFLHFFSPKLSPKCALEFRDCDEGLDGRVINYSLRAVNSNK